MTTGEHEAWEDERTEVREPPSVDSLTRELDTVYMHAAELAVELHRVRGLLAIEQAMRARLMTENVQLRTGGTLPW